MINKHDITGLILAGGLGTRMGQRDKGMLPLHGQPLARHVLQRLAPQGGQWPSVSTRCRRLRKLRLHVWPDALPGQLGPLAGLHSGMRHADTPYLLTVPCDSPLLPPDLAARLAAGLIDSDADLAIAVTEEIDPATGSAVRRPHPVFCLVKTSALPQLDSYLRGGERRMRTWHGPLKLAEVLFENHGAFGNINTPDELTALQAQGLSVPMAQAILADTVAPVAEIEELPLPQAFERILAGRLISPSACPRKTIPPWWLCAAWGRPRWRRTRDPGRGRTTWPDVRHGQRQRGHARHHDGRRHAGRRRQRRAAGTGAARQRDHVTVAPDCIRPGDNRRFKGEDLMQENGLAAGKRLGRPNWDAGLAGHRTVPCAGACAWPSFPRATKMRSIGECSTRAASTTATLHPAGHADPFGLRSARTWASSRTIRKRWKRPCARACAKATHHHLGRRVRGAAILRARSSPASVTWPSGNQHASGRPMAFGRIAARATRPCCWTARQPRGRDGGVLFPRPPRLLRLRGDADTSPCR